jgi:hypothetical protein
MKRAFTIVLLGASLFFLAGKTQAQFNISAEFRARLEYRDGYSKLRDSSKTPYADILGRSRLIFDYKSEKFTSRFSLQHAFVYGENSIVNNDTIKNNTVNIYEGWFRYSFTKGFALRVGRVELIYDDQRLIGASNWRNQGATHDLMNLQWECAPGSYKGDFGLAINNNSPAAAYLSSYTQRNYKYMSYLWNQKKFFKDKLTVSVMAILDAFEKTATTNTVKTTVKDTLNVYDTTGNIIGYTINTTSTSKSTITTYPDHLYARFTVGGNVWLNLKKFTFYGSGYYQGGHYRDGRTQGGCFYGIQASYLPVKALKIMVGYEHLSGNNYSDTVELKTNNHAFSTLYGSNHSHYGYMDLFSTQNVEGNGGGLNQLIGRLTVNFNEKMFLEGTYRWFSLNYGYLPKKAGSYAYQDVKKSLGSEFDFMFVYKPVPNFEINAAYCFMLASNTMELLNGLKTGTSEFPQYAYIMLTYKPNFFSSEKK